MRASVTPEARGANQTSVGSRGFRRPHSITRSGRTISSSVESSAPSHRLGLAIGGLVGRPLPRRHDERSVCRETVVPQSITRLLGSFQMLRHDDHIKTLPYDRSPDRIPSGQADQSAANGDDSWWQRRETRRI